MIENKEIPHYATQVDPEKKEVSCWVESQAEKVVNLFYCDIFIPTNLGLFRSVDGTWRSISIRMWPSRFVISVIPMGYSLSVCDLNLYPDLLSL